MSKAVFCLCDSESQAEIIVNNLKNAGALNNDISVLFPDKGGTGISPTNNTPRLLKERRREQEQAVL
jgi:hypothetical protein